MGKYDSYIIQYCGVVTEFTMLHLRCLKYDSNAVDSNDGENDYLSESSEGEDN